MAIIPTATSGDIRHLPDVWPRRACDGGRIRIELHLEEMDPPVGTARARDGSERSFTGWMGLLEAVSGLVEAHDRSDGTDAAGRP